MDQTEEMREKSNNTFGSCATRVLLDFYRGETRNNLTGKIQNLKDTEAHHPSKPQPAQPAATAAPAPPHFTEQVFPSDCQTILELKSKFSFYQLIIDSSTSLMIPN